MIFDIKVYSGFNNISFGIERTKVRDLLNDKVDSFFRTEDSEAATDSFENLGVFANYDSNDLCEAFEFSHPAEPIFEGKNLLTLPFNNLLSWFEKLDSDLEEEEEGFTSYKFGIGAYAPNKEEEPHLPCEGIIIFKQGYYD